MFFIISENDLKFILTYAFQKVIPIILENLEKQIKRRIFFIQNSIDFDKTCLVYKD